MRVFIAAFADEASRAQLGARAAALDLPGYRLIAPHDYHVTLRFLGSVSPEQLEVLQKTVCMADAMVPAPCETLVTGVRAMPSTRQARVLAYALAPHQALSRLVTVLNRALTLDFGEPDRVFFPHITFARQKAGGKRPSDLQALETPIPVVLDAFGVYQSKTLPDGAMYRCLFPLG
jgi:RNA 2',3'-cyclic 3'-phosphodiesterase